jgi:hypothetical protein
MSAGAKAEPAKPTSPPEPTNVWDQAVAQWRAKHKTSDDHPALLCAQILRLYHDEATATQEQGVQDIEALHSDIASLGEGFTGMEKNLSWVMDELKRKSPKSTATLVPLSIVIFVSTCTLLAGFCLGRAFS